MVQTEPTRRDCSARRRYGDYKVLAGDQVVELASTGLCHGQHSGRRMPTHGYVGDEAAMQAFARCRHRE